MCTTILFLIYFTLIINTQFHQCPEKKSGKMRSLKFILFV